MSDKVSQDEYDLLIHGYIRKISKSLRIDIPVDVITVIYILYPKLDEWDHRISDNELVIDNLSIKRKTGSSYAYWFNGYGADQVTPNKFIPELEHMILSKSGD